MHFLQAQMLWLVILAPAAAAVVWLARLRNRQAVSAWGNSRHSECFDRSATARAYWLKGSFVFLALTAGILSLARPSQPNATAEFPAGTADMVILVDVSRSMAARDCLGPSTRLAHARTVISERLLPALNNNRVGIIPFAGQARPLVFLTSELETVYWMVENGIGISSAPGEGSALGKAFNLAFRYFDKDSSKERKKLIVLLSDGGTDDETRYQAIAEGCRKRSINLMVFGFGGATPASIPVKELPEHDQMLADGPFWKVMSEVVKTAIDESLLSKLATACGGTYEHVDQVSGIHFDRLVSDVEMHQHISERELYFYPALVCWVFILASAVATARGAFRIRKSGSATLIQEK